MSPRVYFSMNCSTSKVSSGAPRRLRLRISYTLISFIGRELYWPRGAKCEAGHNLCADLHNNCSRGEVVTGKRILIVDNDMHLRETLVQRLRTRGFEVEGAESA